MAYFYVHYNSYLLYTVVLDHSPYSNIGSPCPGTHYCHKLSAGMFHVDLQYFKIIQYAGFYCKSLPESNRELLLLKYHSTVCGHAFSTIIKEANISNIVL